MIALLCPSRGRPEKLKRMLESVKATSSTPIRIYYAISAEDQRSYEIIENLADKDLLTACMIVPDNMPTVHKWNMLADWALEQPGYNLFMLAADDMIFQTPLWDEALINHYYALDKKQHVFALQDSRDIDGVPHPILTREYVEAMNYFVPPWFLHWRIDTWTVEIAKANNCFTHLREYELVHKKPSDIGQGDETFNRIRSFGWRERDQYVHEKMQHILEIEKQRLAEALV